jgi:hypothetical protein
MQLWMEIYSKLKECKVKQEHDEHFVGIVRIGIVLFGLCIGGNPRDERPTHALTYIERKEERNLDISERYYIPDVVPFLSMMFRKKNSS